MIVGKPDFQKIHEETDNMIRLSEGSHSSVGDLGACILGRMLRNQQALLRSLDILLDQMERAQQKLRQERQNG